MAITMMAARVRVRRLMKSGTPRLNQRGVEWCVPSQKSITGSRACVVCLTEPAQEHGPAVVADVELVAVHVVR